MGLFYYLRLCAALDPGSSLYQVWVNQFAFEWLNVNLWLDPSPTYTHLSLPVGSGSACLDNTQRLEGAALSSQALNQAS